MLVRNHKGAYEHISSEAELDNYVFKGETLYNLLDNGEALVWFDGKNWIFPRPTIEQSRTASMYSDEMLDVLNQINNKMTELTENLQS